MPAHNVEAEMSAANASWGGDSVTDFGASGVKTDVIAESTSATGVTIDGVLIKDTTIDVNGTANAIVVDADGDTTIEAPTDDVLEFNASGGAIASIQSSGLVMAAGKDVTLGSSGDIVLAANSDIIGDVGTATASSNAATVSKMAGKITSESLTTAQNAIEVFTITNTRVAATDLVFCSVADGTNTQGTPMIGQIVPGAGSFTVEVINKHASAEAFNGTVVISFVVIRSTQP